MLIKGEFRNKENDLYSVYIKTDDDNTQELVIGDNELYFTGDPLIIEENIDNTFETIIRKSCTINLLTKDYIGDKLFTGNPRNIKVNIYKSDNLIFAGYVEPNTFSQPFVTQYDEFSINCIDALSTLQYYLYNNIKPSTFKNAVRDASNITFKSILSKMFSEFNDLDILGSNRCRILYDKSKGINSDRVSNVFDDLAISELYLIGEDIDSTWNYEDTLKEILQYLNLHIRQEGLDFYIYDWNTIKNGRTEWIDILTNNSINKTPRVISITPEHYASTSTNINVADVYNQISLKCNLENIDTVIESPLNSESLRSNFKGKQLYLTEMISEGSGDKANRAINNMVRGIATDYGQAYEIDWYIQNMYSPNWIFKDSDNINALTLKKSDGRTYINQHLIAKYLKEHSLTPALFRMGSIKKQSKGTDNSLVSNISMSDYLYISINGNEDDSATGHFPNDEYIRNNMGIITYIGNKSGGVLSPTDENTTNYFVFSGSIQLQPIVYESSSNVATRTPSFDEVLRNGVRKTEGKDSRVPLYNGGGINSNLTKDDNNGEGRYYTRKFYQAANPTDKPSYWSKGTGIQIWTDVKASGGYKFEYSSYGDNTDRLTKLPILECELIIGNKYCVETNIDDMGNSKFEWLTLEQIKSRADLTYIEDGNKQYKTTFSLGVNPKIGDHIIGDEFKLQNTIDYTMNLETEGTAIPIKKSDALSGTVFFRILGPVNLTWNNITRRHPTFFRHTQWSSNTKFILAHTENIIIKDFKCEMCTDNGKNEIYEDKELIYSSDESQKSINKHDETEFKFVTQLSSNEYLDKGVKAGVLLNAVYNTTNNLPLDNIYNATTNETAKAEEHYINNYFLEYSTPRLIYNTEFQDTGDIDFLNKFYSSTTKRHYIIQSMTKDVGNNTIGLTLKEI